MTEKFKMPHVLEVEDAVWSSLRQDYDPFGNGSLTWRVFYFFRKVYSRRKRKSSVQLYSSYGRTEDEAKVGLVRALQDDWLNASYRRKEPGINKVTLDHPMAKQMECVTVDRFVLMCKAQRKRDLIKEVLRDIN